MGGFLFLFGGRLFSMDETRVERVYGKNSASIRRCSTSSTSKKWSPSDLSGTKLSGLLLPYLDGDGVQEILVPAMAMEHFTSALAYRCK